MATATEALLIGSNMRVLWTGARTSSGYLNSATVTWTLKLAETGSTVSSGSCAYQSGSNGNYAGAISAAVTGALTENAFYFLDLSLSESGSTDYRRLYCKAQYRRNQ